MSAVCEDLSLTPNPAERNGLHWINSSTTERNGYIESILIDSMFLFVTVKLDGDARDFQRITV